MRREEKGQHGRPCARGAAGRTREPPPGERVTALGSWRRFLLLALGLLLGAGLIAPFAGQEVTGDARLYYAVGEDLLAGRLPYRDRPLEYPPLALVPLLLPRLLTA